MTWLNDILGLEEQQLLWYQMSVRAILVFIASLILVRIAGVRTFGLKNAFSIVLSLTVGSVLSRAITGGYPFAACLAGALTLALLHRIVTHWSYASRFVGMVAKGEAVKLFEGGKKIGPKIAFHGITDNDIAQALREKSIPDIHSVKEIWLERDGSLSIIRQEKV
jgi:uncharacterized membrane protein YcaP (DUF421 family)